MRDRQQKAHAAETRGLCLQVDRKATWRHVLLRPLIREISGCRWIGKGTSNMCHPVAFPICMEPGVSAARCLRHLTKKISSCRLIRKRTDIGVLQIKAIKIKGCFNPPLLTIVASQCLPCSKKKYIHKCSLL